MQLVAVANQSKLKIGPVLLKFNTVNQVGKITNRSFSNVFVKKSQFLFDRNELNKSHQLETLNLNKRTFATSQSLSWFWGKFTPKVNLEKGETTSDNIPLSSTPDKISSVPEIVNPSAYNNTGYIPEPPPIIDESVIMNVLGEPTLQSIGLASIYTPVGWAQTALEYFHVGLGLPWYASIVLFAVIMRTCLFPITVKSQQNAARMKKIAPLTNRLREKINEAKMTGDSLKVARATNEYAVLMKSHNIGIGALGLPVLQIPVFVSAFIGIRKMCKLPVESMSTGGILWFENLTMADPTYILPTLSVLSILAVVYRGIETGIELKNMTPGMKLAVFGLSGISFPFLIFMPAGIMVYFVTTNSISLSLSFIMSADPVKKALKIPILSPNEQREIKTNAKKEKNFISGFRESIQNQKIISEVKEREALRQRQFEKAGTQVPQKTFKNNPKAK